MADAKAKRACADDDDDVTVTHVVPTTPALRIRGLLLQLSAELTRAVETLAFAPVEKAALAQLQREPQNDALRALVAPLHNEPAPSLRRRAKIHHRLVRGEGIMRVADPVEPHGRLSMVPSFQDVFVCSSSKEQQAVRYMFVTFCVKTVALLQTYLAPGDDGAVREFEYVAFKMLCFSFESELRNLTDAKLNLAFNDYYNRDVWVGIFSELHTLVISPVDPESRFNSAQIRGNTE